MPEPIQLIPIPKRGFLGLHALIELGQEALAKLAELFRERQLDLSFAKLLKDTSDQLGCSQATLQRAFMDALIPLNGMRRTAELSPDDFLRALTNTVSQRASDDWKSENLEGWNRISKGLRPFFEPDNFFSQASKAFELLAQRPAVLQHVKILNELRPIYNEGTTKTLATIQTSTLVLSYWDGSGERVAHVTLDNDDLESLSSEIKRAKEKIRVSKIECESAGTNLLVYGSSEI